MISEPTAPSMSPEPTSTSRSRAGAIRAAAESPWGAVAAVLLVAVPFVIAAARLATQRWYPVLDLAMTEFRVRDVGTRHTPLIGLPGRIGDFPDQGSHPGPLSFHLVAVIYRILGSAAWAMLVGALAVGLASATACILIARRLGGLWLQAAVVVLLLVVVQGYGMNLLSQPWNPYLPLLPWLAVLLAVWAVVVGDHGVLWVAAAAGSLAAQTHLPYVGLAGGIVVISIGLVGWRWLRLDAGSSVRATTGRQLVIGVVVGVVCWVPVVLDQIFGSQNMSMIVDYFRHPPEIAIGYRAGGRLLFRHLDVTQLLGGSVSGSGELVEASARSTGSVLPGVFVLLAWITAAVVAVLWLRHRRLVALHAVVAVTVGIGAYSMTRIFGKVWYYLTLWAWSLTALMAAATVWTLIEVVRRALRSDRSHQALRGVVAAVLTVVGVGAWASAVGGAIGVEVPEPRLSRSLGAVVEPTAEALRSGVGAADGVDGRYTVLWNDAFFFGSQGYGLISELERRGFDAGAPYTWRVPVTEHRVIDIAEATAVVQLVTGAYLEGWRAEPAAVEIATFEPRSVSEMEEYNELRSRLVDGLQLLSIDPALLEVLLSSVDFNLFGVQLDPAVPTDLQRIVNRMLEIGQETAVFIVPADFYDP
jgi:hypothetical protein